MPKLFCGHQKNDLGTLFFQVLCVLENVVGANDTIVENNRQQCAHAPGHLVNHFTLLATTITWSICAMVYNSKQQQTSIILEIQRTNVNVSLPPCTFSLCLWCRAFFSGLPVPWLSTRAMGTDRLVLPMTPNHCLGKTVELRTCYAYGLLILGLKLARSVRSTMPF